MGKLRVSPIDFDHTFVTIKAKDTVWGIKERMVNLRIVVNRLIIITAAIITLVGLLVGPILADDPDHGGGWPNLCKLARAQHEGSCDVQPYFSPYPATSLLTVEEPLPVAEVGSTDYHKGLYITYYALGSTRFRSHVQSLLETTELNAIVMDVKGDRGLIPYTTTVQLAIDMGQNEQVMLKDWAAWMAWFEERNIYTIARIVVFKDEPLATHYPDWAVRDFETDELWRDREQLGWGDPTQEAVWDYNIALAVEAAQKGFDEIQFDYIRFPTDGDIKRTKFSVENTAENRVAAITGFLAKARQALDPYEVKIAADVFGYTTWRSDDMGIGQHLESMAPYLDVLSPMLYPSTFAHGLPNLPEYQFSIAFPYEILHKSTLRAVNRATAINPNLVVRPWIQDFPDYAFDRRIYTPDEIRLQMDGAREAGGRGWLLWDPRVKYTLEALVSARPSYTPNRLGQVPVLQYHLIGYPEDRWQRTPENFRADLERLLAEGYYPVNLRDLASGDLSMVPAGKRAVVLTFDDSSIGQFRVAPERVAVVGETVDLHNSIDPDSAVGILQAFHEEHPADWPLRATFFVLQDVDVSERVLFGQPEYAQQKLQMLIDWGMEVGSHTISHANLAESSAEVVQWQLGQSKFALEAMLPGYEITSLSVPFGLYPVDETLLAHGVYQERDYNYQAVVAVSGGLAPSPYDPAFDPYHIPRIQVFETELDYWLKIANRSGVAFVSPGE